MVGIALISSVTRTQIMRGRPGRAAAVQVLEDAGGDTDDIRGHVIDIRDRAVRPGEPADVRFVPVWS